MDGRDELLTAVTDEVIAGFRITAEEDLPGRTWLRDVAEYLRDWLRGRPELANLVLARGGSTEAGPSLLTRVVDRLESSGVDRLVAHLAWHVIFAVVIGVVQQDLTRRVSNDGTFAAVLDIALDGVAIAADRPTSPTARRLVSAHGYEGHR